MASKTERNRPALSHDEKEMIFKQATRGLVHRYGNHFVDGMTDTELKVALEDSLGIFGGSSGPGRLSVYFQGAGLKIWGAWSIVNHVTEQPLFEGKATIAMAREVYGISDPSSSQMSLF